MNKSIEKRKCDTKAIRECSGTSEGAGMKAHESLEETERLRRRHLAKTASELDTNYCSQVHLQIVRRGFARLKKDLAGAEMRKCKSLEEIKSLCFRRMCETVNELKLNYCSQVHISIVRRGFAHLREDLTSDIYEPTQNSRGDLVNGRA